MWHLPAAALAADLPDDVMELRVRSAAALRLGQDATAPTLESEILLATRGAPHGRGRFLPVHGDRVWWLDFGAMPPGLVERQTTDALGQPRPPGDPVVPPADHARFGLSPAPELWILEPGAAPARLPVSQVERGSHRLDTTGWGIDLVIGPRAEGSVVGVGPPPASWSARPPPADRAWQARVEADVARRVDSLGEVRVGSAFLGRTAWVRMVQPLGDERSLVTDVVHTGDHRAVVRQEGVYGVPSMPHHLADVDGDGRLDVVLTGCATQVLSADGAPIAVDAKYCR